jgi:glycosyltransferase involved in cell wall biosynthesis
MTSMRGVVRAWRRLTAQIPLRLAINGLVRRQLPRLSAGRYRREDERLCAASGLFDDDWYLNQNPDVAQSTITPVSHYLCWGAREGRDPHPLFDSDWYLRQNPDVDATGINPLVHYLRWGATEGREPSALFDTGWYLAQNPDVRASGLNPLAHYIRECAAEGRNCTAQIPTTYRLSSPPTVSAVIPCYNGAPWLADALASVRAQTLPVDEIIVVDDASVDDSATIARKCGATVIRNSSNRGEGFSRNVGLRHASGELVAWLDADDMWLPHHVSTLTGLLRAYPRATAAFGAVQRFGLRNELILGNVPPGPPSNVFWLAFRDWVHATIASIIHRAALLDIGGFSEHERYSVDFDLWVRLSRSHLFVCTHEVTSRWRWHAAQQSAQLSEQIAALYRFRRSYWERERAAGNAGLAAQMERCMSDIWKQDIAAAWDNRDPVQLHLLNELARLVPGISQGDQAEWQRRSEAAAGVLWIGPHIDAG